MRMSVYIGRLIACFYTSQVRDIMGYKFFFSTQRLVRMNGDFFLVDYLFICL